MASETTLVAELRQRRLKLREAELALKEGLRKARNATTNRTRAPKRQRLGAAATAVSALVSEQDTQGAGEEFLRLARGLGRPSKTVATPASPHGVGDEPSASAAPPDPIAPVSPAAMQKAKTFLVERRLRDWVHRVNRKEGQAPSAINIWAARVGLDSGAQSAAAGLLVGPSSCSRRGRQWVRRWKRRWGVRRGTPRPGPGLEPAELQRKAAFSSGRVSAKSAPQRPRAQPKTAPILWRHTAMPYDRRPNFRRPESGRENGAGERLFCRFQGLRDAAVGSLSGAALPGGSPSAAR
jgi:hypothetical protein